MEGGIWNYASKEIYLKSTLVTIAVLVAAIVAPLFTTGTLSGLAVPAFILVVGFYNLQNLTRLL